ncbi:MAG: preprotein translocase subunit YajC, partial [Candidatus Poribacteria bacterium]
MEFLGGLGGIIPIILIIGVFYFLMIMPQQKKAKKHQNMLKNLTKGDEIVTEGGIYGTVVGIKDNVVVIKIATVKDE